MQVFYDGFCYYMQRAGGINRYFTNLITRLPTDWVPQLSLYTPNAPYHDLPRHPQLKEVPQAPIPFGRVLGRFDSHYRQRFVDRERFAIAHPTYYLLLTGKELREYRCPVVVTVYDMIHEKLGDQLGGDPWNTPERKRQAVEAADHVVCISESTRRDLLEYYPIDPKKVSVTYLASELHHDAGEGAPPDRPYLLYVGSRALYKNFDLLLRSLAHVRQRYPELTLAVTGPAFRPDEEQQIVALGLGDSIQHHGLVGDAELARLYTHCTAFVYPSQYEGFGIPPLEALQCGALPIVAPVSSLPEAVGDAGLYFDLADPDTLTDALLLVLSGGIDRAEYRARACAQVGRFSWEKTTEQTLAIYRSLV